MIMFYFQCHALCEILSRTFFKFLNKNKALLCCVTFFHLSPTPQKNVPVLWLFLKVSFMVTSIHETPTFIDCSLPPIYWAVGMSITADFWEHFHHVGCGAKGFLCFIEFNHHNISMRHDTILVSLAQMRKWRQKEVK